MERLGLFSHKQGLIRKLNFLAQFLYYASLLCRGANKPLCPLKNYLFNKPRLERCKPNLPPALHSVNYAHHKYLDTYRQSQKNLQSIQALFAGKFL